MSDSEFQDILKFIAASLAVSTPVTLRNDAVEEMTGISEPFGRDFQRRINKSHRPFIFTVPFPGDVWDEVKFESLMDPEKARPTFDLVPLNEEKTQWSLLVDHKWSPVVFRYLQPRCGIQVTTDVAGGGGTHTDEFRFKSEMSESAILALTNILVVLPGPPAPRMHDFRP